MIVILVIAIRPNPETGESLLEFWVEKWAVLICDCTEAKTDWNETKRKKLKKVGKTKKFAGRVFFFFWGGGGDTLIPPRSYATDSFCPEL